MRKKLNIIYEDKSLLVIDKPYNILTISTAKEKEKTLYHQVFEYIKKKNQKVYIVNRLDRQTSGIVLFAKNEKLKHQLQDNWNEITKRYYIALVKGKSKPKDTIKLYLKENKAYITYITDKKEGKLAITNYETIKQNDKYSLININILTGRKNQIRASLSYSNLPVVGDLKYGNVKAGHLYLQAYKLVLIHPVTKKEMIFETKIDKDFCQYFK